MKCLFVAAQIAIILTIANLSLQNLIDVLTDPEISQQGSSVIKSSLGEVYGTRPCGGNGRLVQWRIEGCDTTDSPCRFPANQSIRRSEFDFIPSSDIEQLGLRLDAGVKGKVLKTIYESPIRNSTVKAGEQYTSKSAGGVSEDVKGKVLTVQYILYRADQQNKSTEICSEADFEMV